MPIATRLARFYLPCLLVPLASPNGALAQPQWQACPTPTPSNLAVGAGNRPAGLPPTAVYLEADQATLRAQGISTLRGGVHISRGATTLTADEATYEQPAGIVQGRGKVSLNNGELQVQGEGLTYDLVQGSGTLHQAEYTLSKASGRGLSQTVVQNPDRTVRLDNSSYTTCPATQPDWGIRAKAIKLDPSKGVGTAQHTTLTIRNVPVLYLPYFAFPLDDGRKSGFLWPSFGSNERSGLQLSTPYYFNLAPNYDLTLTPTWMGRRGLQLGTELRYLTPKHQGSAEYKILPNDRASTKGSRHHLNVRNHTRINGNSSLSLQAEDVSDPQYFIDLGNSLAATSIVNLERRLEYRNAQGNWSFSGLLQDFQVLDGNTPHARLPQLLLRYTPPQSGNGTNLQIESEFTHFAGSKTAANGQRLDVTAHASKHFGRKASYVKPSLTLRHTEYALDGDSQRKASRNVPTTSLDTGLFLERNIQQGRYVQTLEPRAFYTYTPYREQGHIPVFDSSQRSLNFDQLFAENRFNGKDRIGDDSRLAVAVTTRVQAPNEGRELFRASIGQSRYFADRKVTLPNEQPQRGNNSEVVLEAAGELNPRTRITNTAYWDNNAKEFSAGEIRVRYKDDKQRVANAGYAQRKGAFESASLSLAIPVQKNWTAVGAWEHDLANGRNLETVLGAEYQSCCWKTRIAARNYLLPDNTTRDNAVFVEVELKGLGSFGSGTRNFLQERVYGYE